MLEEFLVQVCPASAAHSRMHSTVVCKVFCTKTDETFLIQLLQTFKIVFINTHLIQMLGNSLENPFITNAIPCSLGR